MEERKTRFFDRQLSRRRILAGLGTFAGGVFLAGCLNENQQASPVSEIGQEPTNTPSPNIPETQQSPTEIPDSKTITRVLKEDSEGSNLLPFDLGDWHFEFSQWTEIRGGDHDIKTIQVRWEVTNTTDKPLSLKTLGDPYQFSMDTPIGQLLPVQLFYRPLLYNPSKDKFELGDPIDNPNYSIEPNQGFIFEVWFETSDPSRNFTFEITDKVSQEKLLEFRLIPKEE